MVLNAFNSVEYLEPRCKGCNCKVEYGVTTHFNEEKGCHVCNNCGTEIE